MAEARARQQWSHTSSILALTANVHRDPKRKPFKPEDFDPFAVKTQDLIPIDDLSVLREFFEPMRKK